MGRFMLSHRCPTFRMNHKRRIDKPICAVIILCVGIFGNIFRIAEAAVATPAIPPNATRPFGLNIAMSTTAAPYLIRDWTALGLEPVNYTIGIPAEDSRQMVMNGSKHVAFADLPLSRAVLTGGGLIQLPLFAAALVLPFNIPNAELPAGVLVQTGAHLTRDAVVKIFTGRVLYWDDPVLRSIFTFGSIDAERTAVIPHKKIQLVIRSGQYGPARWLQTTMSKYNNSLFNATANPNGSTFKAMVPDANMNASTDIGVAQLINNMTWSMGFTMLDSALKTGLQIFALENANGDFIMPTAPVMSDTMDAVKIDDILYADTVDMNGQNVYPIYVTPFAIVHNSSMPCDIARQFEKIWRWVAFAEAAKDALQLLTFFKLGERFWEGSLVRVHRDWRCTRPDGSVELVSKMQFRSFKATSISRRALNAIALDYTSASTTSTVALTDTTLDADDNLSSSLDVLGNTAKQCVTLPLAATALVFAYNTPYSTTSGELYLTREAIVGIFNGSINTWNHPTIAAENRFLPLPKDQITLVVRGNDEGRQLTSVLYATLATWSPAWRSTYGSVLPDNKLPKDWFPEVGANRTIICEDGASSRCTMLGTLARRFHSFGYITAASVVRSNVFVAAVKNAAGAFVNPDEIAMASALLNAPILNETIVPNPTDKKAYPAVMITAFRAPLVYASVASDAYNDAARMVAQSRAADFNLRFSEAAFSQCPSVIIEIEFMLWASVSPASQAALSAWKLAPVAKLDPHWRSNLKAIKCAPVGAAGAAFFSQAVFVLEELPHSQVIIKNGINIWIVVGLGFAVVALVVAGLAYSTFRGRRQLQMVQDLSFAVATFDLESMEWLERKPAKGLMGCYKQILLNMKVYKQYLPSSLTERHLGDDEDAVAVVVKDNTPTKEFQKKGSLPDAPTTSTQHSRANSTTQIQTRTRAARRTESSGSHTQSKTHNSYGAMGAQLRRGTFLVINLSGLGPRQENAAQSTADVNQRQTAFNSIFAIINKAVKDKRGIVEDFSYDRIACHWNLHRNVGDYRLLACECAMTLQSDLQNHIRSKELEVGFDMTITSGEIALSSIGNDAKQRITWISRAWSRAEPMHAFNVLSGCAITVDEATKSAVEYSVECLLVDVAAVGPTNESVNVYELGGSNAMEEGEWMYHNQIRQGVNAPGTPSADPTTSPSIDNLACPATPAHAGSRATARGQMMLQWSSIITCLCVRRNKAQAAQQIDSLLQKFDMPPRLRALACDLKTFLAASSTAAGGCVPGGASVLSESGRAAIQNVDLKLPNSSSVLSNSQREVFMHQHLPAAFQWIVA